MVVISEHNHKWIIIMAKPSLFQKCIFFKSDFKHNPNNTGNLMPNPNV